MLHLPCFVVAFWPRCAASPEMRPTIPDRMKPLAGWLPSGFGALPTPINSRLSVALTKFFPPTTNENQTMLPLIRFSILGQTHIASLFLRKAIFLWATIQNRRWATPYPPTRWIKAACLAHSEIRYCNLEPAARCIALIRYSTRSFLLSHRVIPSPFPFLPPTLSAPVYRYPYL
jgi:hypothetical protein